ncbi:LysR family transcriptional regulator [Brotaphodocola sp.]|uniref:LysR family transcriptional regulator n=1 Tax=Brotaphodocola sp. TaxID=3073577 RepID=UPI003D7D7F60
MDFRQYQYVLKVAELQNMTKAANELYITQPSLSHYIARVEEEMGTRLFNRDTTPISLTPAGERYVETARMILALNDRLKQDVTDIAKNKKGVIRVGMSHARASFFLPYVLPEFKALYPGIDVRTVEVRSDLIEEYVAKGQCDIGVLPLPLSGKHKLEQEVICREELLLVSGTPLEQAGRRQEKSEKDSTKDSTKESTESGRRPYVNLGELGEYPFTLLKKGHGIRTAVDVLFMEHGISPKQIFETTSNETAYRLSTVDMGLSIVPETTVILSHAVRTPYLYALTPNGIFWEIGAVYRERTLLTGAQKEFIRLMQEKFAGCVSGIETPCHL